MAHALVVYCSHGGTTRLAAQDIASLLGADVREVDELGAGNVADALADCSAHDVVVVGASTANPCGCNCVRAFLEHADTQNVAFFCVESTPDAARAVMRAWTRAARTKPVAAVVVPAEEVESGHVSADLYRFADDVRIETARARFGQPRAKIAASS
jgi:menaquinone-dependent protoporphyrinogen IX oxidase